MLSLASDSISEVERELLIALSQCVEDTIDTAAYGDPLDIAMGKYDLELSPEEWIKIQGCWDLIFEQIDHENLIKETHSSVVTAGPGVTSSAVIDGFEITGGSGAPGGGIYCYNSSPIISNNTITGNNGGWVYGAGGIGCYSATPTIINNTITGNSAVWGGGINCYHSPAVITNNIIEGNTADFGGGINTRFCSPEITDNFIRLNIKRGIFNYEASPLIAGNTIIQNIGGNGSGIGNSSHSSPVIRNNTITENSGSEGGGIYIVGNSHATITNNTISGNSASLDGGGIRILNESSAILINNIITGNSSGQRGGGIIVDYYSSSDIINNTIVGNYARYPGGGIEIISYSSATIKNNIISSNRGPSGNPWWWGIVSEVSSQVEITYSDVWDNGGNYLGCSPGIGCISANPLFVDPAVGDYHLQVGSPCIDAGDPDSAYNDPDGTRNDMGAYGGPGAIMSLAISTEISASQPQGVTATSLK